MMLKFFMGLWIGFIIGFLVGIHVYIKLEEPPRHDYYRLNETKPILFKAEN